VKAAYADPPYFGLAQKLYGHLHPDAAEYDKPETHKRLIDRLCNEYDCWAMSLHSPTLKLILDMCPDDVRVMPWMKPWAPFRPGVSTPHFAWEPVIVRGGRPIDRRLHGVRDYCNAPMRLGGDHIFGKGAKSDGFCFWLFEVLNLNHEDEFHDVFPGSGAVSAAWEKWKTRTTPEQFELVGSNVQLEGAGGGLPPKAPSRSEG
jgi:hypothetical protein